MMTKWISENWTGRSIGLNISNSVQWCAWVLAVLKFKSKRE